MSANASEGFQALLCEYYVVYRGNTHLMRIPGKDG